MRAWIALGALCLSAPASAGPQGGADLTMQASYANVGSPPAAGGLEHMVTVGTSLRGALGDTLLYECAGYDFEVGGGVPGAFFYDTNLYLLGAGVRVPGIATLKLCAGGGLSGITERLPFSLQAPIETSLVAQIGGRVRLHAWARGVWLAADARHDGSGALPSFDELSAGVGLSLTQSSSFRYQRAASSAGYFVAFRYGEILGTETYGVAIGYRIDGGSLAGR